MLLLAGAFVRCPDKDLELAWRRRANYVNLSFYLSHTLFICVPLARFLLLLLAHRRTRPWHEPAVLLHLCNTESFGHMDKTCLCVLVISVLWYGVSQVRYPQKLHSSQVQTSQGNPDLRIKSALLSSRSQTQQIWLQDISLY